MATLAGRPFMPFAARALQPTKRSLADDLEPTWREIFLSGLAVIWFAAATGSSSEYDDTASTIGLVYFSLVLGWAGYRQMARNVSALWTPLLWYRVAMLTYFGVGSLVPIWSNAATRTMMEGFYEFYSWEILKLNLLVSIFHVTFLCTSKILFTMVRNREMRVEQLKKVKTLDLGKRPLINRSAVNMIAFGVLCLAVGSFVNFFIVFPVTVGWFTVPLYSTFYNLVILSWIGYFMVTLWSLQTGKRLVLIFVILVALGETMIGFFAMSKSVIMMPMVMVGIGFVYHKRSLTRIAVFGTAMISTFLILSPMMGYVRNVNGAYYANYTPPEELPKVYASYFDSSSNNGMEDRSGDIQEGWLRLSYVNAGTFAISQYDNRLPGNSYRYWAIVWIPRAIYPNKPFITDVSREFSYLANGNFNSSSSPGLPAEGYWNGGWLGVIGIACLLSIIMSLWSIYSFIVIERQAWHLFFIVLLGMRMSIRMDGALVSDVIGPIGIAFLAHLVLELLNRFLPQSVVKLLDRVTLVS